MSDSVSEVTPKTIKYSNKPDIQDRVEQEEARIEDRAPHADKFRTSLELPEVNREARDRVASQIKLEREKERKYKDQVTGLRNRMWFEKRLAEVAQIAKTQENPNWAIIMYDIDFFKRINEAFGHPGGDKILGLLKNTFRKDEDVARYGGEEIAQIVDLNDVRTDVPLSDDEKLEAITDRPRTTLKLLSRGTIAGLKEIDHNLESAPTQVTLSFGISKLQANEDPKECVQRASEGALHAKSNGRNRGYIAENQNGNTIFKPIGQPAVTKT